MSTDNRKNPFLSLIYNLSDEAVIGHYTQFVWGESYQIGCGILISKVEFLMIYSNKGFTKRS